VGAPESKVAAWGGSDATKKAWTWFVLIVGALPFLSERIGRGRWPETAAELATGLSAGGLIIFLGALVIRGVAKDHDALRTALRELEHLALTDALTGAWNARALHQNLEHAREGWIITADLDRLKVVNDEHGHAAGDQLLARATNALRRAVGSMGMVFRTGGDEFVLLLLGAGEAETLACAEAALSSMQSDQDRASFSLGLARLSHDGDPWSTVARADQAMYAAKRSGGGRFVVAP
jgi:diguanylate cyclase (GGDEF)-like protein